MLMLLFILSLSMASNKYLYGTSTAAGISLVTLIKSRVTEGNSPALNLAKLEIVQAKKLKSAAIKYQEMEKLIKQIKGELPVENSAYYYERSMILFNPSPRDIKTEDIVQFRQKDLDALDLKMSNELERRYRELAQMPNLNEKELSQFIEKKEKKYLAMLDRKILLSNGQKISLGFFILSLGLSVEEILQLSEL